MKKMLLVAALVFNLVFFVSSKSFAEVTSFKIFDNNPGGNDITGTILDWVKTPWLQTMTDKFTGSINFKWFWGTGSAAQFTTSIAPDISGTTWSSTGSTNWDTMKIGKTGWWSVEAHQNGNVKPVSSFFLQSAPPGVVPEPISSTLFLLGGAALGIKKLRNRNKKA